MLFLKRSKIQKSQRGFTLVAVLILSGLASILVLSSIKDNVNQERLSGNFQKKINARLMSERGIFDAMAEAKSYLNNNSGASVNDLAANIADLSKLDGSGLSYGGMKYRVQLAADGDELVLSSTGNRFEGEASLKVRLKITPGGSGSAFVDAIVGCDAVNLSGSGQIDSYNSGEAAYNESSLGVEGNVTTINKDGADVTLGGFSPIYGDINATGNINTASSNVKGNLHANGDVVIGSSGQFLRVSGNVLTRGNYLQKGGKIGGYVRANLNAEMGWSMFILNSENIGLDILYGGSGKFLDTNNNKKYKAAKYNVNPNVARVKDSDDTVPGYDPTDPATNCDHLDIDNVIEVISLDAQPSFDFISRGWGDIYRFDSIGLIGPNNDISPTNAQFLGEPISIASLKNFHLKGSDRIDISGGDMTLFVDGDFTMDGATQITIDADSSLTLVITGTVNMLAGAKVIAQQQGLTTSGLPAMSIYSSFDSTIDNKPGIKIEGNFETYAQIYAPLSDVVINGSGTLYGAVRGKTISVTGGAAIHYDAALGAADRGGNYSSKSSLQFVGFEY